MFNRNQNRASVNESIIYFLEAVLRLGVVSGAAVAAALGKFLLAGLLAALAVAMFLRFWRGRIPK